jgi:hypothetical protein
MKTAATIAVLLWLALLAVAAQTANPPAAQQPARPNPAEQVGNTVPAVSTAGLSREAALRTDLTRMRAILYQMQNNLAFVQTTQGPLKHQFELDIEMWQALIQHMEHALGPESGAAAPVHP